MQYVGNVVHVGIARTNAPYFAAECKVLLESIEMVLELRFGSAGVRLMPEIRQIRFMHILRSVHSALRTVETVEDVRRIYATASTPMAANNGNDLMALFNTYFEEEAYGEFEDLTKAVDWSTRQPDEMLDVIQLALYLGMPRLAIAMAQEAGKLFPDHEKAQTWAHILAPPVVRGMSPARPRGLLESSDCIRDHAKNYPGQWLAARKGVLVGAAPTFQELQSIIEQYEDPENILVSKAVS